MVKNILDNSPLARSIIKAINSLLKDFRDKNAHIFSRIELQNNRLTMENKKLKNTVEVLCMMLKEKLYDNDDDLFVLEYNRVLEDNSVVKKDGKIPGKIILNQYNFNDEQLKELHNEIVQNGKHS